jgi:hypothetical protein
VVLLPGYITTHAERARYDQDARPDPLAANWRVR